MKHTQNWSKRAPVLLLAGLCLRIRLHRLLLLVSLVAMVLYYAIPAPLFGSKAQGDGWFGFHYLPAMLLHRSVDMRTVAPQGMVGFDAARDGRLANRNPIGPSLVMLPVYTVLVLGEAGARRLVPGAAWLPQRPFAVSDFQVFWVGLISVAAVLLGMSMTCRLLRRHVSAGPALGGTIAAVYATPIFWYATVQPHYQPALTFGAVALFLEKWDSGRGSPRRGAPGRFLLLGAIGGVAMLMRTQEFVFLLAPGCEGLAAFAIALHGRELRLAARWAANLLLLGVGAALAFSPQLAVWGLYFGLFSRPTTVELLRPLEPAIVETLFSMRCGLLPWTPVVYLAALGVAAALVGGRQRMAASLPLGASGPASLPGLLLPLLVVFAADLYVCAAAWTWYGAYGYGCRRLSDCAPLFGLGAGVLLQRCLLVRRAGWRRAALASSIGAVAFCVAFNLLLTDILRRRVVPSSGSEARPAYRSAALAHAPAWVVRLLRHGYPFAQPAGWIFALWHRAPMTAWEGVVGNYALEREAHVRSYVFGERWDFSSERAEDWVIEGLQPIDSSTREHGRPVDRRVRLLLQPFGSEPIRASLSGDLPMVRLTWDGVPLSAERVSDEIRFLVPAALVRAHRVAELTIDLLPPHPSPPRLRELRLRSFTNWWEPQPPASRGHAPGPGSGAPPVRVRAEVRAALGGGDVVPVVLRNEGTGTAYISVSIVGRGASLDSFLLDNPEGIPPDLPAGGQTTVGVKCAPSAPLAYAAVVVITSWRTADHTDTPSLALVQLDRDPIAGRCAGSAL